MPLNKNFDINRAYLIARPEANINHTLFIQPEFPPRFLASTEAGGKSFPSRVFNSRGGFFCAKRRRKKPNSPWLIIIDETTCCPF
jgi:hypothetical protein